MIPKRPYGTTGIELSLIAMGGIVVKGLEQSEANRTVRAAFDRGINYYDVAPSYGDSEERLGPALVGLRDSVFLACKTMERKKEGAAAELRRSLQHLHTDRFDLYQLHALSSVTEVETCFGEGGAMEAILEAKAAGLVRYIGFSAHNADAALEALRRFPFDSILFPFNVTTWNAGNFGPQVMQAAIERGAARLALKAMARRPGEEGQERMQANCWYEPYTDSHVAELALRWTLSLPITAAVPPGDPVLFQMALDFAERFTPLSDDERAEIEREGHQYKPLFAHVG